ncbi:Peptidoglycan-N-acetylmuramic acid deacetylase PdaC [Acidipropionibacterium virtanenii]|uniref:Peptidoglycan-N-acetylmuramic acid deacetylase PdaC n=1 Tax=Acidipropionibacterium virtanenii TaxID=2057246 RepID=A0A344UX17_9ACTN|nr:Peptidoglycan-N-acetylmuramic acid deacetylase PdaC [Acidipropionibacterium virtanenii]
MLAALSLSACNGSSGGPGGSGGGKKGSNGTPAPAAMTKADPGLITGAIATSLKASEPRKVSAAVPQIPKARNLTQALEVVRERTLRQAAWDKATAVEISTSYLAASTDVIGVLVTSTTTTAGKATTALTSLWYDAQLSQTFSPSALISWPGWAAFAKAVGQAAADAGLDKAKALKALQDTPAPYGTGPAISFDTSGGLVVDFPPGAVKADPTQVRVTKKVASPLLSDFGTMAEGASTHPSTFTGTPTATRTWWTPGQNHPKAAASPNVRPLPGDSTAPVATASASPSASASAASSGPEHPSTAIGIDCVVHKAVALTYDDGPGPETGTVLAALAKHKGAATFFEMGNSIDTYPKTTVLVAASGYEIGSHTVTHPDLASLGSERLAQEITGNNTRIKKLIGRSPLLLRPPYGSHNESADAVASADNLAIVNWSVDTEDWKTKSTSATEAKVFSDVSVYTEPIILMHDIHDFTVAAAEPIIEKLTAEGYKLVTVSEMTLNTGGFRTGHGYCRGTSLVQDGYLCKG